MVDEASYRKIAHRCKSKDQGIIELTKYIDGAGEGTVRGKEKKQTNTQSFTVFDSVKEARRPKPSGPTRKAKSPAVLFKESAWARSLRGATSATKLDKEGIINALPMPHNRAEAREDS